MSVQKNTSAVLSPGIFLQNKMDEIGMSQKELAYRMGRPLKTINEIVKGRNPITVSTALQIETVLGISSEELLSKEKAYRISLARIDERSKLEKEKGWTKSFPTKQMIQFNWIPDPNGDDLELTNSLLKYFGVTSSKQWEEIYIKDLRRRALVSYRQSLVFSNTDGAVQAWLRKGEKDMMSLNPLPYDKSKFKNAIEEIRSRLLIPKQPENFLNQLKDICGKAGVTILYTEKLPKAPISGAARWINDMPVIQLTDRYNSNDRFWFTFFHEVGHIILHAKKPVSMNFRKEEVEREEEEVDAFANKWLVNQEMFDYMTSQGKLTKQKIWAFSEEFNLHPGVIVGHLQYKEALKWSQLNDLKVKINIF